LKILLVNNYYYNRGGDCTYLLSLENLLKNKGHKVVVFSMHHPQNFKSEFSEYFVSYIDYREEIKKKTIKAVWNVLKRTFFSKEAMDNIEKLIKEERPDIAHIQNIHHHITPSIFKILKKNNIPIVWTLHDYTAICPNTSFLTDGKVCERCRKRKYYWPVLVRCKKKSIGASAIAALEIIIHRIMRVYNYVDKFIAPSRFLKHKFVEYGFKEDKIAHLDHFIDFPIVEDMVVPGDYYLFVGRISEEKGVKTLIDAASRINAGKLKIAGDGPLLDEMIAYVNAKGKGDVIEFLGHKSREDLFDLYRECKFLIVPSEWYENSGLIIFEAFACGKAVIGSNMGGIPELVKNEERGMIFKPGDSEELSAIIQYLINNPDKAVEMGKNARNFLAKNLNAETHYLKLTDIYKRAIEINNA
jgi:glycosyltransferase involved in cell wall biosynthesis